MVSAALSILNSDEERNIMSEFYRENKSQLYAIALVRLNNAQDAEDAVQDTFLRIAKFPERFFAMDANKRLPYTVIIIRNVINDMIEKRIKNNVGSLTEDTINDSISVEENVIGNVLRDELLDFIESMPEAKKQAILLKVVYGYTNEEIANVLEISESAARKRISDAYRLIKKYLNGGIDDERV